MTEDEVKTKWCPFARVGFADLGGTNSRRDDNINCIGSACMAWRGAESADFKRRADAGFKRAGERIKPTPADIDGYCGLAGPPS